MRVFNGATMDRYGKPINPQSGYVVGVRSYPNLGEAFRNANPEQYVGYWRDNATGLGYVDVVEILPNLDRAERLGREKDQIAIWDFASGKEIRLKC